MCPRPLPLLSLLGLLAACNAQEAPPATDPTPRAAAAVPLHGDTVTALGTDLDWIFQDRNGDLWIASNGQGVYHYADSTLRHITTAHGLCSDHVWKIEQDVNGALWFTTPKGFCRLDERGFTDLTPIIRNAPRLPVRTTPGDLYFAHEGGICQYNGRSFVNFTITPPDYRPEANDASRPYSVYCTMQDRDGHIWLGTEQKGVCRFDGHTTTWFTEAGLSDAAVRSIFQDRAGHLWFGNNGAGLFRYDGHTLTNLTEAWGLGNPTFLKELRVVDDPVSIARVWTLSDDATGALLIGTIDSGLWKLSGEELVQYTTRHGLPGNSIWMMAREQGGGHLIITDGTAISRSDGRSFTPLRFP
jgi:ligand-binding sensor domain-containing protein